MSGVKAQWVGQKINMETGRFEVNWEEFESKFNEKTRIFLFNNPGNPLGKVFTRSEIMKIREILLKWPNVVVLADEVYDNFIYDDNEFIRFASIPDMWERTISVISAGKLFSITGWRIGYGIGPEYLIKYLNGWSVWM